MAGLTDRAIRALKPKAQRYEKWDGNGFGVRVTPRGTKTFVWVYHHDGRPRRLTLGTFPEMTLADAHIALAAARKAVERGEDPGKAAVEERQAERQAETVDELCQDYIDRHAKPNKRSAGDDERRVKSDILPSWRGRKAKEITRRDVVKLIDAVVDRGSPVSANRLHALLSRLFNFAVERGVVEHSPVHGVKKQHKEKPRARALSAEEITAGWHALDRSTMEPNLRKAARLLLVTVQRRGEVLGMHEREIDRAAKLWTIPEERSKNGRPHIVPLSPLALEIIGPAPDKKAGQDGDDGTAEAAGWIFPSPRTGGPYRGASLDHAIRDLFIPRTRRKGKQPAQAPLAGAERWTPHDLRRTGSTRMRELGVSRDDVGLVLNHADRSVTGRVYDKYEGLEEKKRALLLWAHRLAQIIKGEPADSNVVQMPAAATAPVPAAATA